jgi:hypothetical protein
LFPSAEGNYNRTKGVFLPRCPLGLKIEAGGRKKFFSSKTIDNKILILILWEMYLRSKGGNMRVCNGVPP